MCYSIPLPTPFSRKSSLARVIVLLAILAAALLTFPALAEQAPAVPTPTHKSVRPHDRRHKAHLAAKPIEAVPAPLPPPKPELPKWPANDRPVRASVKWDSEGLRIDASNSSLHQIMKDVATATGTKVEGLGADERVFGAFGPGLARDVLSQLLHGSGYNVIMIGDQGRGAPRQLVLSSRHPGTPLATASNNQQPADEEDTDPEEPPQPPTSPIQPSLAPGAPPRTPQQIMQEMQERQLEMQRNTPPN